MVLLLVGVLALLGVATASIVVYEVMLLHDKISFEDFTSHVWKMVMSCCAVAAVGYVIVMIFWHTRG